MLPLDSPLWRTFDTYTGEPGEVVPDYLSAWWASLRNEDEAWCRLRDQFLCQGTIKPAALAAAPHVWAALLSEADWPRVECAIDLGQAHAAWMLRPPVGVPGELVASYEESARSGAVLACSWLPFAAEPVLFRYLLSACASLCGHPRLGTSLFESDGEVGGE